MVLDELELVDLDVDAEEVACLEEGGNGSGGSFGEDVDDKFGRQVGKWIDGACY